MTNDDNIDERTEILERVLNLTLKTADLHAQHLTNVIEYLRPIMPLTAEKLGVLTIDEFAYTDAFIMRFSKLQDLMGSKLFTLALDWAEEGPYPNFLDKLHALERLGCIPGAQKWLDLREMRNYLAHDYPDDCERIAHFFNSAFELTPFLLICLVNLKNFVTETTSKKNEYLR